MSRSTQRDRRNLFTLVEEATHLLRRAPASAWLGYYLGSAPFVVFLFFFWNDMAWSPLAWKHLVESSLILALLFAWMKVWQARFCGHLLALVEGREDAGRLPLRGWMRLIASQTLIHASMPWLLTLAGVAVIPTAWAYAFYHNVTILAVGHFREGGRTKPLLSKALAQAHYAPKENHFILVLLAVFGPMVYLNLFVAFAIGSQLLKSITGTENAFSLHPMLYFSTALQALLISVSYLIVNPFVKALYVLRCFYGEARKSGADIEVSLRAVARPAVLVLLLAMMTFTQGVSAADAGNRAAAVEQAAPGSLPDKELDQSIRDVLQGSEYQWRLPRDTGANGDASWLGAILRSIGEWFDAMLDAIGRFIGSIWDWFFGGGGEDVSGSTAGGSAWIAAMPKLVIALVVLLVAALIWMLWKNLQQSRQTIAADAEAVPPEINLESENVLATQLPENEWLRLAREKMEAGELRLALRALFLATLAHLGEKRLLLISRSKSNGDYVRELNWRARGRGELSDGFTQQVRTFDRVWYGWHDVSQELMVRFQEQHEQTTSHAT